MVMHARSGGNLEVMGLMLGKVDGETMNIMDSFALPVEGTETRVNAQAAAYEYMAAYIENAKQVRPRLAQKEPKIKSTHRCFLVALGQNNPYSILVLAPQEHFIRSCSLNLHLN